MAPLPCLPRMFHFTKAPARALPGAQAANSLWTRFGEALVIQPGVAWCERSFIHEGHARAPTRPQRLWERHAAAWPPASPGIGVGIPNNPAFALANFDAQIISVDPGSVGGFLSASAGWEAKIAPVDTSSNGLEVPLS